MTNKKKKYKSKNFATGKEKEKEKENNLLLIECTQQQVESRPKQRGLFSLFGRLRSANHQTQKNSTIVEEDTATALKMMASDPGVVYDNLNEKTKAISSCESSHGGSSSICESLDTYSSASSPPPPVKQAVKSNLSVVESTSFQDTTANKSEVEDKEIDDSDHYQVTGKELKSFGQNTKYNTLRAREEPCVKVENNAALFKYNTASKTVRGGDKLVKATTLFKISAPFSSSVNSVANNNVSSFKANTLTRANAKTENTDAHEDYSQGNLLRVF